METIEIREHLKDVTLGRNDTVSIRFDAKSVTTVWSTSGIQDEFTEPESRTVIKMDISDRLHSLNGSDLTCEPVAHEAAYEVIIDGESVCTDVLPDALRAFLDSFDPYLIGLERDSERAHVIMDTSSLDALLRKGVISQDTYDKNISSIREMEERRSLVTQLLEERRYMSERSRADIVKDYRLGLLTEDEYGMSSSDPKENTMVSAKLKLSVWGLRIGGRFDTFEFIVDRDDCMMTDRSYCVHGTLFEGCGNYKAPDTARYTEFTKERTESIFQYLGELDEMGILGKNYSEPRYDCGFFDLYIRYEYRDSVHTKGTTEYPYFIKYLMYLMDAKESL